MRIEQEVSVLEPESKSGDRHRPALIKWKNETIIRPHSLRATVNEILNVSKALDVVKIGIIGEPSTGKTTLAETLQHLIHKMSDQMGYIHWTPRVFGEEEFLNLKATLEKLEPANYIIYFHDLSFLSNKRALEEVKQAITKIRHMREDVKIILIYDYHYSLGLDKYLRQANFRYFTSIGSSEMENMTKMVGTRFMSRLIEFQEMFVEMTTKFKSTHRIGPNKYFSYSYKNPFVSCLFYNNQRLRYVAFPKREWIDPICSICSASSGRLLESEIPVQQFIDESEKKFGRSTFLSAIRLELFTEGLNVYSSSVVSAQRYLQRAREKKLISMEEIATHYGLEQTKARLRKKLDGVLE